MELLLRAAAAAPDHGRLRPTRFVSMRGEAKNRFGLVLEAAYRARCARAGEEAGEPGLEKERTKLDRAPLVLVAVTVRARADDQRAGRIPWREQRDSTAAAVQNLLLAATSLGFGSMWRTGEAARDPAVVKALGFGPDDEIAGFVYLGTVPDGAALPPNDPDPAGLMVDWEGA